VSPETRIELRTGLRVALLVLVAGLPLGLIWWQLAPEPLLVRRSGGIFFASESESAVAADGWFAVCAATAGLVAAVAVFALTRRARVGALLGLAVGGIVGALVAWRLGMLLGPGPARETARGLAVGSRFNGPLRISARGVLLIWPLVSVVAYFALTAGLEPPARRHADDADALDGGVDPSAGRRFPVTVLRPGYAVDEVDRLLRRVDAGQVGADEVRHAQFTSTRLRRGYDETAVDNRLAGVADSLTPRDDRHLEVDG
jgi:DivIVA domain-containing protein